MAKRCFWPEHVVRLLMVPLVALWPMICCCWFEQLGCGAGQERLAAEASAHHEGGCHEQRPGAEQHSDEPGGCHGDTGGPCHGDGSGGCACSKSQATMMDFVPAHAAPALALAWLPTSLVPMTSASTPARWSLRVERPPPPSLAQLRILRI